MSKDNTNIKKQSTRPLDPILVKPAEIKTDERLMIEPFDDGHVFKFAPHPKAAGQFVIYGRNNEVIAVSHNPAYCNLICDAVRMLFSAAALAQAENDKRTDDEHAAELAKQDAQENSVDKSEGVK